MTDTESLDFIERNGLNVEFDKGDVTAGVPPSYTVAMGLQILSRELSLRSAVDTAKEVLKWSTQRK